MPRAKHPCAAPGCPAPVPAGTSRCPAHTRERDRARGTARERGYGTAHRRLRASLATLLDAGATLPCARCGAPITKNTTWHLDHDDTRTGYLGPSCATCNTSAGGRAAHDSDSTR